MHEKLTSICQVNHCSLHYNLSPEAHVGLLGYAESCAVRFFALNSWGDNLVKELKEGYPGYQRFFLARSGQEP